MGGEETGRSFAAPLVLPIEFGAIYFACEAATFSRETAISRLRRASEEVRRIEALHHNQFDEVIRCREHGSTYSTPAKIKRWKTDQLNTGRLQYTIREHADFFDRSSTWISLTNGSLHFYRA